MPKVLNPKGLPEKNRYGDRKVVLSITVNGENLNLVEGEEYSGPSDNVSNLQERGFLEGGGRRTSRRRS